MKYLLLFIALAAIMGLFALYVRAEVEHARKKEREIYKRHFRIWLNGGHGNTEGSTN